jgi:hypothetical protein
MCRGFFCLNREWTPMNANKNLIFPVFVILSVAKDLWLSRQYREILRYA